MENGFIWYLYNVPQNAFSSTLKNVTVTLIKPQSRFSVAAIQFKYPNLVQLDLTPMLPDRKLLVESTLEKRFRVTRSNRAANFLKVLWLSVIINSSQWCLYVCPLWWI